MRGEGAHMLVIELAPVADCAALTPARESAQVAQIGRDGVFGQASLGGQMEPIARQPLQGAGQQARSCQPRASASLISSLMRARNSVLIPG